MKEDDTNGERKMATQVGLYVLRSVNTIVALLTAVGVLWIKANVPSKEDFKELQVQLRAMELTVAQLNRTHERLDKLEERMLKQEASESRRFPPPRRDP